MRKIVIWGLGLLLFFSCPIFAHASTFSDRVSTMAKVQGVRVYTNGDSKVRVVLDTSKKAEYRTFVLSSPTRIGVDIKGAWLSPLVAKETPVTSGLVGKVRISQFDQDTVRIVVEANVSKDRYKIFTLKEDRQANRPERIVMDFGDLAQDDTGKIPVTEEITSESSGGGLPVMKTIKLFDQPGLSGKIIAVDPGHGGSDAGAIGARGSMEKNVTLAIALELQKMLKNAGAQVVMTRTKDVDVAFPNASAVEELQARVDVANKAKANIFVSIHMDAFVNRQARGTSTYIYPKTNGDGRLGQFVKDGLVSQLGTDDRNMRNCNFYVVKHTTMPATLAEVAFISNPNEEAMLTSGAGVKKAATGIFKGIDRYFSYE